MFRPNLFKYNIKKNLVTILFLWNFINCKNKNEDSLHSANAKEAGIDSLTINPKEVNEQNSNEKNTSNIPIDKSSRKIISDLNKIEKDSNKMSHINEYKPISDRLDNIVIPYTKKANIIDMLNKHLKIKKEKIFKKKTNLVKVEVNKGKNLETRWKNILDGAMKSKKKKIDNIDLQSFKSEVKIYVTQNENHNDYDDIELQDTVLRIQNINEEIPKVEDINNKLIKLSQIDFGFTHITNSLDKKIETYTKEINEIKSSISQDMNSEYGDPYRTEVINYADDLLNKIEEKNIKMKEEEESKQYEEWEKLMNKIDGFEKLNKLNIKNYINQLEAIKKNLIKYPNLANKIEADISFIMKILPEIVTFNENLKKLNNPKKLKLDDFEKQSSTLLEMLNPKLDLYNPDSFSEKFIKKCALYVKIESLKFKKERKDMVAKKEEAIIKEFKSEFSNHKEKYDSQGADIKLEKINNEHEKLLEKAKKIKNNLELKDNKKIINGIIKKLIEYKDDKVKNLILSDSQKKVLSDIKKEIEIEKNKWIEIVKEGLSEKINKETKKKNTEQIKEIVASLVKINTNIDKYKKESPTGIFNKKISVEEKSIEVFLKEVSLIKKASDLLEEFKKAVNELQNNKITIEGTEDNNTQKTENNELLTIYKKIMKFYKKNDEINEEVKSEVSKKYIEEVRTFFETVLTNNDISFERVTSEN